MIPRSISPQTWRQRRQITSSRESCLASSRAHVGGLVPPAGPPLSDVSFTTADFQGITAGLISRGIVARKLGRMMLRSKQIDVLKDGIYPFDDNSIIRVYWEYGQGLQCGTGSYRDCDFENGASFKTLRNGSCPRLKLLSR